jgi:iron complex outermembrane receptor protein
LLFCRLLAADAAARSARELADLSIEELMNEAITSVAKKETTLFESPAAIAVLTADDLRRLGVTVLPEALRWVPGLEVGRINAHTWAISARGFLGQFSDKLLVLIDGRTIYDPEFAGVRWDEQDLVLADLDRIEVVRGPGATLWGANAANGVINILTKSARETPGTLVTASAGTEDRPAVGVRYGGRLAPDLHYRFYLQYFDRGGLARASGADAPDDWRGWRGGFRADWQPTAADAVMVQGELYREEVGKNVYRIALAPPFNSSVDIERDNHTNHLLGRWTRTLAEKSHLSAQTFYAHSANATQEGSVAHDTLDFQLEHRFAWGARHDIIWGVGYRRIADEIAADFNTTFTPDRATQHLYSAFMQDDIALVPQRWQLSLGSKFEHNDPTGYQAQPSARLLWRPTERQTVWAAVSRAVRTPSRFERDGRKNVSAFLRRGEVNLRSLLGDPRLRTETLLAYELGYRVQATRRLVVDIAVFYNVYDHFIDASSAPPRPEATPPPPHLLRPLIIANTPGGDSHGAEVAVQWNATDRWRLSADYRWLHLPFLEDSFEFDSPEQQARLLSFITLPGNWEFSAAVVYADRLRNQGIPDYVRLDLGAIFHPRESFEIGVWGQNLLDPQHPEFPGRLVSNLRTEIPRSVAARLTWRF